MARHGRSYQNVGLGVFPPAGGVVVGVTYTDSCTGTITLSGTRVEGKVGTDARSGQVTLSGVRTESNSRSESRSGTVFLTGTVVEVFGGATSYSDSPTGTIFLNGTGSVSGAPEDTLLSWLRIREKPSLNQSVMVTTSSGKTYRWGEDDPVPEKSFHSLTYGSGVPGGFDQMTATLPRKRGVDYSDLELFSNIQVLNAGGEVVGEYRLDSAPVTAGNDFIITPNAVGYQAALEDRKDCAEVFVDIDLSHWGSPSSQWLLNNSVYTTTGASTRPDVTTGAPSLFTGTEGSPDPSSPQGVGRYDAGSFVDIASVYYAWTRHANVVAADTYYWDVQLDSVDTFTSPDATGNLKAAGPGTGTLTTTAADNRFAQVHWYWNGVATGGWDVTFGIFWTMLAVYGEHGLTKRGSGSATTAPGFYASDVIEYIVNTFTNLNIGTIDATTFVIPQLEFRTPTTAAEMVKQANRFHLFDWYVGPGQRFHYRERGTYGRHWLARVGPAKLEATGQTAERCPNKVLIGYQDVDGTPKTVGPVGSEADVEDATLAYGGVGFAGAPNHPATAAGLEVWAILDMGQVSTSNAALQVAQRFLAEINELSHSGRAELTGHVMNDAGVLFPYSSVQAGDTITFMDAADTSERRIVKATKGSNSVSIDLDAPPEGTQALLERLGVQWTNLSSMGAPFVRDPRETSDFLANQALGISYTRDQVSGP
jgi:hypothetical protein